MRWTVPLLSSLAVLSADPLAAQIPPQKTSFSAESVIEFGDERIVGRSYVGHGVERHELSVDGLEQVTILRPDLDRAYVAQEGVDALIELPIEEAAILPPLASLHAYQATEQGREAIDGEQTTRYLLTSPKAAMGPPEITVWMTDDGIVVRMQAAIVVEGEAETVVLSHRKVVRGEQDPMLFDPLYRPISQAPRKQVVLPPNWGVRGP